MGEQGDKSSLKVLDKVIKCLQKNEQDMIPLLESFLHMVESGDEKKDARQKLLSTILTYTENITLTEIKDISAELEKIILPEKLRSLILNKNNLEQVVTLGLVGFEVKCYLSLKNKPKLEVSIKEFASGNNNNYKVFKNEATILSDLDHPNIVKILGVTTKPFRIIMELPKAHLLQALMQKVYTDNELLKAILEITTAMKYLSSKKIILRNLAINNIIVDKDNRCKIANFELSCFADKSGNHIESVLNEDVTIVGNNPAPEILLTKHYKTETDVYDMGLLIWEMYMIAGKQQMDNMLPAFLRPFNSQFVLKPFTETGKFLKPNRMPDKLYEFIKNGMLNQNPERRPTFSKIEEVVSQLVI